MGIRKHRMRVQRGERKHQFICYSTDGASKSSMWEGEKGCGLRIPHCGGERRDSGLLEGIAVYSFQDRRRGRVRSEEGGGGTAVHSVWMGKKESRNGVVGYRR